MTDRHLIDVHLLLVREERVLLSRRRDTVLRFNDRWHLPSGKIDAGESALAAAAREAEEELGVVIAQEDLRHYYTAHVAASGIEARLGLFFEVRIWRGEPENREPDKCSALGWFSFDDLPGDLITYSGLGIRAYRSGASFDVYGW